MEGVCDLSAKGVIPEFADNYHYLMALTFYCHWYWTIIIMMASTNMSTDHAANMDGSHDSERRRSRSYSPRGIGVMDTDISSSIPARGVDSPQTPPGLAVSGQINDQISKLGQNVDFLYRQAQEYADRHPKALYLKNK